MKYVIQGLVVIMIFCAGCIGTDNSGDWNEKGNNLLEEGKYTEAIQAFNTSIELDPQNGDAWVGKGIALTETGKRGYSGI